MKRREDEEKEEEEEEKEEEEEEEEEDEDEDEEEEEEDEEEEEESCTATQDEDVDKEQKDKPGGDDDDDDGDDAAAGMKKNTRVTSCADRKCVPGIIYLGHIPPRLRPKHLRNLLSVYGEIGRIFLQPEDCRVGKRKRKSRCNFSEGWVEFRDKRVAKRVAMSLHNTHMGNRKRQRFFSDLWSIKYLHRFHWTHLSERLAYEQTVLQQRLRTEVSQAKRETNFYLNNVDKSARLDKLRRKRRGEGQQQDERTWDFTQRQTEEEIQKKKRRKEAEQQDKARLHQQKSQSNVSLLAKIFNKSE